MTVLRRNFLKGGISYVPVMAFMKGGIGVVSPITGNITGATITPSSFLGGAPDSTVVGSISVQTTGPTFAGTIAIGGTDAAKFKLSSTTLPSNLELNGTQAAGSYHITLTLTDATFTNSPFTTTAITISGSSSGAIQLATQTWVNDNAGSVSANQWYLFRRYYFKQGDIPAGTAPQFLLSGTTAQPYSWGLFNYWPDGSLEAASFMFRPTFGLTAFGSPGSTQAVGMWTNGVAPSASARSLASDIYPQNISVNGTAAPVTGANITGSIGAWVTNDANNVAQYLLLDGDAGRQWKIETKCAAAQGGSAVISGQLTCDHYVTAFTDVSGNLGCIGHLAKLSQPYYDLNGTTKNFRAFSALTWQYGAGPTVASFQMPFTSPTVVAANSNLSLTSLTWAAGTVTATAAAPHGLNVGSNLAITIAGVTPSGYNVNAAACHVTSTTQFTYPLVSDPGAAIVPGTYFVNTSTCNATGNNFYCGAALNTGQVVPCFLTTTVTLPAPLSVNTVYFLQTITTGSTVSFATSANGGLSRIALTTTGTGTHTINPIFAVGQFCGTYSATTDAKHNIFQGTGSIVSPALGGGQYDQTYAHTTKTLQPYDLSLLGTITPTTFPYTWNPASIGPLYQYGEASGSRSDIAPMSGFSARHFYTQSKVDEFVVRCNGLAATNYAFNLRDSTTRQLVNTSNTSYTGMLAPSTTQKNLQWVDGFANAFTFAASGQQACMFFSQNQMSHMPEQAGYAYYVTGEAQYLDEMVVMANGGILVNFGTSRNPTVPYADFGLATGYNVQPRSTAWGYRNLMLGAALAPDSFYDGSQLTQYLRAQSAASSTRLVSGYLTTGVLNSYCVNNGFWMMRVGTTGSVSELPIFEMIYVALTACWHYSLTGDAGALAFMQAIATWCIYRIGVSPYSLYGFYYRNGFGNNSSGQATSPITQESDFAITTAATINWTTSSPAFSTAPTFGGQTGWTPGNGDSLIFSPEVAAPSGGLYAADTTYYMVNVSGSGNLYHFDLAATPGGTAIAPPTTTGSQAADQAPGNGGPWYQPLTAHTSSTASPTSGGADSYKTEVYAFCNAVLALGVSSPSLGSISPVLTDVTTRMNAEVPAINWNSVQNWAMQSSF